MVLSGATDDSKNRKMFSHREHGFPTARADARDEYLLGLEGAFAHVRPCFGSV